MTNRPPPLVPPTPWASLAPWAIGAALWFAVSLLDAGVPSGPGEPLCARWLRKLAEHPLRGSLALGLLLAAGGLLRGPRGAPRPLRRPGGGPEVESEPESG